MFGNAGKETVSGESRRGLVRRVHGALEGRVDGTDGGWSPAGGGDSGAGFGPTRATPAMGCRAVDGSRVPRNWRPPAFGRAVPGA